MATKTKVTRTESSEDKALIKLMKESDRTKKVSRATVMNKLKS